jgi:hypothetical protein
MPRRFRKSRDRVPDEAALTQPGLAQPGLIAPAAPDFTSSVRRLPRHTYGAIDLGTNNCRLLVARPAEEGFTVVDAFSRVVRLGEGLGTSARSARKRWIAPSRAVGLRRETAAPPSEPGRARSPPKLPPRR